MPATSGKSAPAKGAVFEWVAASGVAAFAFLVRALSFSNVFHAGQVVFAPADAMYHVRRSFYTFESWPHVLLFDPYVNYPDGAPVPWSPLPDVVAGTIAALFASDETGFATVLAWWPAFVGGLGALPIYFLARAIANRTVALGAGCLYALLPISVAYGRVGNPDHHVSVAAVGACLLLVCAKCVAPGSERRLRGLAVALALLRAVMLLTWHGSLLYLAVVESTLLLASATLGRRDLHAAHAASALGTLLVIAPILAQMPTPLLGLYSSIALSRLHLIAVAGAGVIALAGWWHEPRAAPVRGPVARIGFLVAVGVGFAFAMLALPGPREGLEPALRFLTMTDAVGSTTIEQFALFSIFGRTRPGDAANTWGFYAYLLPVAPLALVWWAKTRADAGQRAAALVVAGWAGVFGLLALSQRRYGNEVAASASVGFAVAGALLTQLLHSRARLPRALAATLVFALGAALYAQPIQNLYWHWATRALAVLSAAPGEAIPPPSTVGWSIHRFLLAVRAVTPETRGYTHPAQRPEYGIVSQPNLGHALQWVARRATPTDPFWEYIGPENWDRAEGLLMATREVRAVELARELGARYVVVGRSATRGRVADRLFVGDGLRGDRLSALRRFRLVTEGPRGGHSIQAMYPDAEATASDAIPYKLFEIVRGARLEIAAPAGSRVEASIVVRTPTRREFTYQTAVRASEDGVARLRVPYSSMPPGAERATHQVVTAPSWRIEIDQREAGELFVPEEAVLAGGIVAFAGQ